MITLKNNTGNKSRVGYLAKVSSKGGYFEYAGIGDPAIGVITQSVGTGDLCEVMTSGIASVYVKGLVKPGDQVRMLKDGDGAKRGQCVRYTQGSGDVLVGRVLERGGNGLVRCYVDIASIKPDTNFTLYNTQWVDEKVPFTRDKQGQSSKPDFDFTELGLLFPQNNEGEEVYLIIQFNHDYKLGTSVSPHLHYIQDESGVPVFEMTYRWYDNGESPGAWTTIETANAVATYTSGSILQILEFPMISGVDITGVSSFMDVIIRRQTGDGITGDVLVKEFDIHYQKDSMGSNTEYVK